MTQHAQSRPGTIENGPVMPSTQPEAGRRSAWAGWVRFAGAIMILLGLFNVIEGIVALFKDNYYAVSPQGLLVFDLTGWGWVHLIIGVLAVGTGVGLFSGAGWARICAVVLATINAVAQLTFLSAYPVWATVVIALDVVVIWAVIVHGGELKRSS